MLKVSSGPVNRDPDGPLPVDPPTTRQSAPRNVPSNNNTLPTRRGKAPPVYVDSFSSEDVAIRLDDWVPTLKRAAAWNHWSTEDQLFQLAGHLRGHALQEWDLIPDGEKRQFQSAIEVLRECLKPGAGCSGFLSHLPEG